MKGTVEKFDTVVIGAGVAGVTAALCLKRRGKKVGVLSSTGSASLHSSGSWDYCRNSEALEKWLIEDREFQTGDRFQKSCEFLSRELGPHLKMATQFEKGFVLPTSAGVWKRTSFVQDVHSKANLLQLKGKKVGFVTSDHFRQQADNLCSRWRKSAERWGASAEIRPLPLSLELKGGDWPVAHLATRLQHDSQFQTNFKRALMERTEGHSVDLLLFPPLFMEATLMDALHRATNTPCAETLSTSEPTAGYRLNQAFLKLLRASGISQFSSNGSVRLHKKNRIIQGIETANSKFEAKQFVLATGRALGGGICIGFDSIEEPIFHLPLFIDRESGPIVQRSQLNFEKVRFQEEQPWSKVGVWVDSRWQPINQYSERVFENLFACGSIVGGVDYSREGMGMGLLAASAMRVADVIS